MKIRVKIKDPSVIHRTRADFIVTPFKSSGPGGQHRNKTSSAVRIKDKITGLSAEADESRSQHVNKQEAFLRLAKALIAHYEALEEPAEINRERIRSYHEPRGVVLDHRNGRKAPYTKVLDGAINLLR